ncbi:hypothetical protein Tdes44962_MAKER05934 [Teratosphaeria destructans]|uniref:Uncharacterized protein n=1 Tax=Teratosphaeria destructans TaxID=418781 RepID=A0A9W7VYF6_9PEZI|nr:hypothetical protein Tdes44962_MAKER05934 [Teratosphaeria destructans]
MKQGNDTANLCNARNSWKTIEELLVGFSYMKSEDVEHLISLAETMPFSAHKGFFVVREKRLGGQVSPTPSRSERPVFVLVA